MKTFSFALLIVFTLVGCATSQRIALASFSIDNASHNSLIENRRPQYGISSPDGCITETAFSLRLRATSVDSISGVVHEAGTTNPVLGAKVRALPQHATEAITTVTNSAGHFAISRAQKLQRFEVSMPGYRTLIINLGSEKLL
jgi:hypothetical protein